MKGCAIKIWRFVPLLMVALSLTAFGQNDSSGAQDNTQGQDNNGAPPAATGATGSEDQALENPPLSGLDKPRAEPLFGGRSYIVPGVQLSEGINTDLAGFSGGTAITAVSRALGSIDLQKLWKSYQVGVDYVGGGAVYTGPVSPNFSRWSQEHTLSSDQRIPWRTGQLAIRDSFNYLPEGTFGFNSYGGAGAFGSALGTGGVGTGLGSGIAGGSPTGFLGGGQFIGYGPHVENLSIVDVTQELSPRSTVTVAGSFDVTDFLKSSSLNTINGHKLINSQAVSGQAGYNRLLSRKDQIGVVYAFQEFHFPSAGSGTVVAHVWSVLYSHRLTGRLNFVAGGGPEILQVRTPATTLLLEILPGLFLPVTIPASTQKSISGDASVSFDYTWSARTTASIAFLRYVTTGSGFFAGANTDATRLAIAHRLTPHWNLSGDFGFAYSKRLLKVPNGPAGNATSYQYWYMGASVRRQMGPHFDAFASYQFNQFGSAGCGGSFCGSHQQIGTIGLNWHPNPIRLD